MTGASGGDLIGHLAAGAPVVLDGGLGTHLAARGQDVTGALWSAAVLREHPDAVRAAHEDFFRAGAEAATACSYQVSEQALAHVGADPAEAADLIRTSVRLAREAAEITPAAPGTPDRRWVLASVGPYGACPGVRGSEYDADHGLGVAELAAWHHPRLQVLADAGADALIIETVPGIAEVEALLEGIEGLGVPTLLAVTIAGRALRDGTPLADLAELVRGSRAVAALGVNCCSPGDAIAAMRTLTERTELPLLAYPNSGEDWDREARTWIAPVARAGMSAAEAAPVLRDTGAQLIGGCCRVGPAEITTIARAVRER